MVLPTCRLGVSGVFQQKYCGAFRHACAGIEILKSTLDHLHGATAGLAGGTLWPCATCLPAVSLTTGRVRYFTGVVRPPFATSAYDYHYDKHLTCRGAIFTLANYTSTREINSVAYNVSRGFSQNGKSPIDSSSFSRANTFQEGQCISGGSEVSLDVCRDIDLAYGSYSQELLGYIKEAVRTSVTFIFSAV